MIFDGLLNLDLCTSKGAQLLASGGGVSFTLSAAAQQSCFLEYAVRESGREFYSAATWHFPAGYTFDAAEGYGSGPGQSFEHKLFCVFTADAVGRILVKLRGRGLTPRLSIYFEHLDDREYEGAPWPADGLPHRVEFLVERTGSAQDRVQVWLDGRPVIDVRARTCGKTPSPTTAVQVGAYRNQSAPRVQEMRVMGPIVIGDRRPGEQIVVPPVTPAPPTPVPVPPSQYELAALDLEKMAANASDLARRVRALGQGGRG
jgi:hypothetical protein